MEKKDASSGKVHVSTSPSRGRSDASPALIAGREVVGRKIAVWKPKAGIWRNGTVSDFSDHNLRHMVRYDERGAREEEWLNLGRSRFSWLSEPAVGCASNPTVVQGLTPSGKDAVDHKVKVFWPAMGRWYIGRVSAFDGKTGRHTVQFKDGDKREYTLRHEAVVWLDVPGLDRASRLEHGWHTDEAGAKAGADSQPAQDRAVKRLTDTEQGSCSTGAHKGEGKRAGNAEPTSIAKRTRRSAQGGANPAKAVTSPCSEAHSQECSHPARAVASPPYRGQQADSPCHASKSAEPATTTFNADGACNGHGSQNRGEEVGRPGHTPATSSSAADQDIDVVNLSSGNPDHGHSSCAGGEKALKAAGDSAKDAAGKEDELSPRHGDSAGKRLAKRGGRPAKQIKRGGPRRSGSGLDGSDTMDLGIALETIVGARVGVWWDEDETYYKGEVTSFDSYHKRSKISYDDGEEMWVALQRETFTWITPRAFGAGANATMLGAMRFVGAKNATAEPKQASTAADMCPGAPTPAVAVLPAVASSPSGAKVRQVSVASADGFAFGPIAACSAIEAARESAAQATNPRGPAAVGRRLSLTFTGDNSSHKGEVLAFNAEKGQHLVFYDDGEDEWVDLSLQHVTWHEHVRGVTVAHGLPAGTALPKGKAAVGWRVAVYWRDDKAFYPAEIMGYDIATGRHDVEYDDGEEEEVSLTREKVKWLMPPGVRGTAASESDDYEGDDSDEEEEEDEEEALIRRNRRRGRSAQRRSARQARRRSPSDPGARSVRFRPSRFAREASTPPNTSPYARRQTAHGSLGLYPEDDDDGHVSMYASTRPILAPTRAEARPVFTREVSAERGVRLPGGSRLQGVTRVSIYLSEDPAYDVKPEPEKAGKPLVRVDTSKPNATELLAIAEKLCERTASKREAELDRNTPRASAWRGTSVDMSVVMRRVAMARAEIADRDRLAQMADEEDEDEYERSGVTVPVADASDHKAAQLASMASGAFLTPPSLPNPLAHPLSQAGVPTGQSFAGPGRAASQAAAQPGSTTEELLADAAGAAPPGAGEAPALWAAMRPPAHLHSPFSSPAIQMLPAGLADAAQRLMNGGAATTDPALASTAAPEQAASQLAGYNALPSSTHTMEAGAAAAEMVEPSNADAAAAEPAEACASLVQQPDASRSRSSLPETAAEPSSPHMPAAREHAGAEASEDAEVALTAGAAADCDSLEDAAADTGVEVTVQVEGKMQALRKLALLQQMNSSFSIPETPSLGDELRGGFKLPQHLDSLKMNAVTAAGIRCRVEGGDNDSTPPSQAELDAVPEGVTVAQ